MVVLAGFIQGVQMAETRLRPELGRPFEATLTLATSRFHRAAGNGPTPVRHLLGVHAPRLTREKVRLLFHRRSGRPPRGLQARNLLQDRPLLTVPQLMQASLHPRLSLHFIGAFTGASQRPEMFAAMVEIQQLPGLAPAGFGQSPNPRPSIGQGQNFFGPDAPSAQGFLFSRRPNSTGSPNQRTIRLSKMIPRLPSVTPACSCR